MRFSDLGCDPIVQNTGSCGAGHATTTDGDLSRIERSNNGNARLRENTSTTEKTIAERRWVVVGKDVIGEVITTTLSLPLYLMETHAHVTHSQEDKELNYNNEKKGGNAGGSSKHVGLLWRPDSLCTIASEHDTEPLQPTSTTTLQLETSLVTNVYIVILNSVIAFIPTSVILAHYTTIAIIREPYRALEPPYHPRAPSTCNQEHQIHFIGPIRPTIANATKILALNRIKLHLLGELSPLATPQNKQPSFQFNQTNQSPSQSSSFDSCLSFDHDLTKLFHPQIQLPLFEFDSKPQIIDLDTPKSLTSLHKKMTVVNSFREMPLTPTSNLI
ncbi:uncharacterized protein HKW66_Vig0201280 [Vigna angularis]|uniref:Uncharacterized protein n=1 Tax=Phaseolus angularis TaxID=3914 RepID=A0A8T0JU90_PHAAN|nr:uncharacterized protein HKW66_Vig0201280 [Vigna angularis]